MIYLLDFRKKGTGGAVTSGRLVAGPGLGTILQLRRETQITILLHGFNVNRRKGKASLFRLANLLSPGVREHGVLAVLWPGDHWTRALSYSFEGKDADDSAKALARYLQEVVGLKQGTRLQFVAHSLGARVALETVKTLPAGKYAVGQVCLLGAAVDDFGLDHRKQYHDVARRVMRTAVLASRSDRVLKLAYPLGDFFQRFIYFRKELWGLALGFHGPKSRQRHRGRQAVVHHVQIPDHRKARHSDYVPQGRPTREQTSAIDFTNQVLGEDSQPHYPP